MERFNLEALNQFWLDYQQPLIWLGLAVAGLLLLWVVVKVVRRARKVPPPSDGETQTPVMEPPPLSEQTPAPEQPPVSEQLLKEEAEAEAPSRDVVDEPVAKIAPAPVPEPIQKELSIAERFKRGLAKTRQNFARLFVAGQAIDEELLEELETHLLMADIGMEVTQQVLAKLSGQVKQQNLSDQASLQQVLGQILLEMLAPCEQPLTLPNSAKPHVILMVGVNGVGKTTTIGKLAKRFQSEGKSVMLAAGDTFRAAAVEQLQTWGERNNVPVVAQHTGADSASVIFDANQSAQAKGIDLVIADTAGRLHNKDNLMEELKKVIRVMKKLDESAPHEVLLVLDAATGQNALSQMREFQSAAGVTGVVLTKLDGTAKGGVIFPLCNRFQTPVRFVGVGEGVDDLQPFAAREFVEALFDKDDVQTETEKQKV